MHPLLVTVLLILPPPHLSNQTMPHPLSNPNSAGLIGAVHTVISYSYFTATRKRKKKTRVIVCNLPRPCTYIYSHRTDSPSQPDYQTTVYCISLPFPSLPSIPRSLTHSLTHKINTRARVQEMIPSPVPEYTE